MDPKLANKIIYSIIFLTLAATASAVALNCYDFTYIKNIALTAGVLLCIAAYFAQKQVYVKRVSLLPIIIPAWLVITAALGKYPYKGIETILSAIVLYAFFFVAANLNNPDIKLLRRAIVLSSLPAVGAGAVQVFAPQSMAGFMVFGTRVPSLTGNPNFFGAYLVALMPLIIFEAAEGGSAAKRAILWAFSALALLCLAKTGSKGAYAGLALELIAGFCIATAQGKISRKAAAVAGVALVLALAAFVVIAGPANILKNDSVFFRLYTWKGTLGIIRDNPLTGTGLGTFSLVYPEHRQKELMRWASQHSYETTEPENILLQTAADTGLIGLGILLFIIYIIGRRVRNKNAGFGIGLAGLFATNLVGIDINYVTSSALAVVFAGIVVNNAGEAAIDMRPRIKYAAAVVFLLLLTRAAMFQTQVFRSFTTLEKAVYLSRAGDAKDAIPLYEQAVREYSYNLDARYFLASAYMDAGSEYADKALAINGELARDAPDYVLLHYKRASAYLATGDAGNAEKEYKKALALDPYLRQATSELAYLYTREKRYDEAEQLLIQGIENQKDDAALYNNLGNVYFLQGRHKEALEAFKNAIALKQEPDYYYNAGAAAMSAGEKKAAREFLSKALALSRDAAEKDKIKRLLRALK